MSKNKNNFRNPANQDKSPYRLWMKLKEPFEGRDTRIYYAKLTMSPHRARLQLESLVERHRNNIQVAKLYDGKTNQELQEWRPDEKTEA